MSQETVEYLTAAEVAKRLRVTKQTALKYLKRGTIPGGIQLGDEGIWRVRRAVFEQWLKEKENREA